jgi:hypothetical protein
MGNINWVGYQEKVSKNNTLKVVFPSESGGGLKV